MIRAELDDLKARQIAFMRARLVSPDAERAWREHLPAAWAALLATRLRDLADAASLNRALDAALSPAALAHAVRPAARAALAALSEAARTDRTRLEEHVPAATRPKIDRLLERPDLIPEPLVRNVMESDAIEEVMRDVLYEALKEFSEKVNPFFADWGLPALLKRLAPFGFGGVGKSANNVRAEFERRLEPEIRKFLQGFSRKAMRDSTDALVSRADQPKLVGLRKRVAAWVLTQEIRDLARRLDDQGAALAQEIAVDIIEHDLGRDALAAQRRDAIDAFFRAHRDRTLGEILARHGIAIEPDFDAVAAATWPLVRTAAASAPAQAWVASLITEFFDSVTADP